MIFTQTPLRLSFVGGGTDLPHYYKHFQGSVISTTLNQYVYVGVNESFSQRFRVIYSEVEEVNSTSDIAHPLVRHALNYLNIDRPLEIFSIGDIPGKGSGLGSSSSFTVGLVNALALSEGKRLKPEELASIACHIEMDMCNDHVGKQDQYAAAIGGFNRFYFETDGSVNIKPLSIDKSFLQEIEEHLMVFHIGGFRSSGNILAEQINNLKESQYISLTNQLCQIVDPFEDALVSQDIERVAEILDTGWKIKKSLSKSISSSHVDDIYTAGKNAGALGGKLLGAGGTGFIIFLVPKADQERVACALHMLKQLHWNFSKTGTTILHNWKDTQYD